MICTDERHLLYIEPTGTVELPGVEDELTAKMERLFHVAEPCTWWKGTHRCRCGAQSDACDYALPGGMVINSLCVHYLRFHRSEVPRSELAKLVALHDPGALPAEEGLSDESRRIITETLERAIPPATGGVRSWVLAGGVIMTNYVPFRSSAMAARGMNEAERAWALSEWARLGRSLERVAR